MLDKQNKIQIILLLFLWAVVQSFLFFQNGIVSNLEATKYINEANYFLQYGKFSTGNFYLYSTEIFLISIAIKLKTGYLMVVAIHWIINLYATYTFYKLAYQFLKSKKLAFIATFIFIINIPYQLYNSFLFTESIFYSLTIIFTGYLLNLKYLNKKNIIAILLFLVLLSITRPTGILFFGATAIYIFFRFLNHWTFAQKSLLISASSILFVLIINSMMQSGGELNLMLPFVKENIICGVDTINHADIIGLQNDTSLYGLFFYIFHNAGHFFELAWLKTVSFFSIVRSYYSLPHNLLLILFYYPFYGMAILGIRKVFRQKKYLFFISIIFLYWFTTVLTCDDWHGRFFLTISPFLFLLGLGLFSNRTKKEPA